MNYQQIIAPVFPLNPVGLQLTNEGDIDVFYLPSSGDNCDHSSKIIRRRFADGSVKWFEEVQF